MILGVECSRIRLCVRIYKKRRCENICDITLAQDGYAIHPSVDGKSHIFARIIRYVHCVLVTNMIYSSSQTPKGARIRVAGCKVDAHHTGPACCYTTTVDSSITLRAEYGGGIKTVHECCECPSALGRWVYVRCSGFTSEGRERIGERNKNEYFTYSLLQLSR